MGSPTTFPPGAVMSNPKPPPVRTSHSCVFVVKPFGPNHFVRCSSFVHAAKTSSRGAWKTRDSTISRSSDQGTSSLLATIALLLLPGFRLQLLQVVVELLEALA